MWDWDRPMDFVRLLVKDVATGSLLSTSRCGTACYSGKDNVLAHTPIVADVEMIVVAAGARLVPPADWRGCLTALATICMSGLARADETPSVHSNGGSGISAGAIASIVVAAIVVAVAMTAGLVYVIVSKRNKPENDAAAFDYRLM